MYEKENQKIEKIEEENPFEKKYSPGNLVEIKGKRYIANLEGYLVRVLKNGIPKPKPEWEDINKESIQDKLKKYEIAHVIDKKGNIKDIIVIRQYKTDYLGKSLIISKAGKELPRKAIALPADKEILSKIVDILKNII